MKFVAYAWLCSRVIPDLPGNHSIGEGETREAAKKDAREKFEAFAGRRPDSYRVVET